MKLLKIILLAFTVLILSINLYAQDNAATPEYEATKQTEKLQQELNLSTNQVKQVYEINLKYARARQSSVSRSEAMERMKNKDTDLQRVLNNEQINRLQNKRYERSSFQSVNPTNYRSVPEKSNTQSTTQQPSDREMKTETRRTNTPMQTSRRAVEKENNEENRRVAPQENNQRSSTPSRRSVNPSPPQNTENKRSEPSRSDSQRR